MIHTPPTPRRARVTYANVTATLALVVALGGTSYAAVALPRNSVGAPQLKSNAVTSAKIRPGNVAPADLSLASRRLAAKGPVSPGAVSGTLYDATGSGTGITNFRRASLFGQTPYSDGGLGRATSMSPNRPMVVRSLSVRVDNDVPPGGVVRLEVVVTQTLGVEPDVLSCEINGTDAPGEVGCRSTGAGQVPANSFVYMFATVSGGLSTTNPGAIRWGMTMEVKP